MILNDLGRIVSDEIIKTFIQNDDMILDEFIVMPNHIHLIICINKIPVETSIYRVSGN
jgi:REP element-mobilizing transposase RayT